MCYKLNCKTTLFIPTAGSKKRSKLEKKSWFVLQGKSRFVDVVFAMREVMGEYVDDIVLSLTNPKMKGIKDKKSTKVSIGFEYRVLYSDFIVQNTKKGYLTDWNGLFEARNRGP